jgi:hypothetical protein
MDIFVLLLSISHPKKREEEEEEEDIFQTNFRGHDHLVGMVGGTERIFQSTSGIN